uniref:TSC22 domain family protein 1 isoform X3 n=1 Tax=Vespula vulgaris TaxID=7454 RepID=UPI00223B69BE|nr:TSC22 domain family protein 1 isoform X3 [Vespula vulgaris]
MSIETTAVATDSPLSWHIPRPSLGCPKAGRTEKDSENGSWAHHHHHHHHHHHLHPDSPSRGSTSSQGSTASTHSAASGTLLLTAANLANLAAMHPPTVTTPKQMDTASVASSTHFTVVNGLGRPTTVYRKSWCARNQLTVLVCTMSFLFMVGLLAGILFMESECLFATNVTSFSIIVISRRDEFSREIASGNLSVLFFLITVRARDKYN